MPLGRDLCAFCRPPLGTPVSFGGMSTYPNDGSPVCGLFDRGVDFKLQEQGTAGVEAAHPLLTLPCNAFATMPQGGDTVFVTLPFTGLAKAYEVGQPTQEDDGAFWVYDLYEPS